MRPLVAFVSGVVAMGTGVDGCRSSGEPADASPHHVASLAVLEPEGVFAKVWIRAPDAIWARLQRGTGGIMALLPPSAGDLACALAGIPPAVAPRIRGDALAYGLVAFDADGTAGWVVALPVADEDPASVIASARDASGPGVRIVGDMYVASAGQVGVGAAPGWLLLGGTADDVARFGPFAYRSMPAESPPASAASVVALATGSALTSLAERASGQWVQLRRWLEARGREARERHGGRRPDFGDPETILAALDAREGPALAFVGRAARARLDLEVGDDDVRADWFLTPGQLDPSDSRFVETMQLVDTSQLGAAPGDTVAALLDRDDPAAIADGAQRSEAIVQHIFGDRLSRADAHALKQATLAIAAVRTGSIAAGVSYAPSCGAWLRVAVGPQGASRAFGEFVTALGRPSFLAFFPESGPGPVRPRAVTVEGLPGARFANYPPAAQGSARTMDGVAWAVSGGELLAGAGPDGAAVLATLAAPGARVADDARSARMLSALGERATFVLFARPLRLDPRRANSPSAPVVLAWGRDGGDMWGRVDVSDVLVSEIARLRPRPF